MRFEIVAGPATLSGEQLTLTGTGTVRVRATQLGDTLYAAAPAVERSFVVTKASAVINFYRLAMIFDGAPKPVYAATMPNGLHVRLNYEGSAGAPSAAGSYVVAAIISDANYEGAAVGTLTIARAEQTIDFAALEDRAFSATPVLLSASATSGLPVSFSVVSGPARLNAAGDALVLTGAGPVVVRASQAGDANRLAAPSIERTFTVAMSYAAWCAGWFTAAQLAEPTIAGTDADPDHDGCTNLLEYALGTDPWAAGREAEATSVTLAGGEWRFSFMRPADRPDLTYEVESSTDLVAWSASAATVELSERGNGVETWTARRAATGAANCYFRLVVRR